MQEARERLAEEIQFYRFQQHWFYKQWCWLKTYANNNGVKIVGDVPIYVALTARMPGANPLLFQFDEENKPLAVAGCPPDGFFRHRTAWETRFTAGNITGARNIPGGYSVCPTVWRFMMWCALTISGDLTNIIPFPMGMRRQSTATGKKVRGWSFLRCFQEKLPDLEVIGEDLGF